MQPELPEWFYIVYKILNKGDTHTHRMSTGVNN